MPVTQLGDVPHPVKIYIGINIKKIMAHRKMHTQRAISIFPYGLMREGAMNANPFFEFKKILLSFSKDASILASL